MASNTTAIPSALLRALSGAQQRSLVTGSRDRDHPHMTGEVEGRGVYPYRLPARHADQQPSGEQRDGTQSRHVETSRSGQRRATPGWRS